MADKLITSNGGELGEKQLLNKLEHVYSYAETWLAKARADGRVTIREVAELLLDVVRQSSAILALYAALGETKKAAILYVVGHVFDRAWPLIPIPLPFSLAKPFLQSTVKAAVLAVADGAIEFIYQRMVKGKPATTPISL